MELQIKPGDLFTQTVSGRRMWLIVPELIADDDRCGKLWAVIYTSWNGDPTVTEIWHDVIESYWRISMEARE